MNIRQCLFARIKNTLTNFSQTKTVTAATVMVERDYQEVDEYHDQSVASFLRTLASGGYQGR
jgi:hypothetical protein